MLFDNVLMILALVRSQTHPKISSSRSPKSMDRVDILKIWQNSFRSNISSSESCWPPRCRRSKFLSSEQASSIPLALSVATSATPFSGITSDMSLSISNIMVARLSVSGIASSTSAPTLSSASAGAIVFYVEAGDGVCSIACIMFIIHRFFCPPVAGAVSFDYKRLVRSNLRGLSIANGMGSFITFRIFETSTEEGEEELVVLSGTSCTFVFTGDILTSFRFLGAESFGSDRVFLLLHSFSVFLD